MWRHDRCIVMVAAARDGSALEHAEGSVRHDVAVALAACVFGRSSAFVAETLRQDADLIAAHKSGRLVVTLESAALCTTRPAYVVVTVHQEGGTFSARTAVQPARDAKVARDSHFWSEDLAFALSDAASVRSIAVEVHIVEVHTAQPPVQFTKGNTLLRLQEETMAVHSIPGFGAGRQHFGGLALGCIDTDFCKEIWFAVSVDFDTAGNEPAQNSHNLNF